MRIGIDARFYGTRGLGRYTSELIRELESIDDKNDYVIFLRRNNFDAFAPKNPRFKKVLADIPWYGLAEQIFFPPIIYREGLDLMHFPHFNVPVFYRKPFVVTIHDLILLSHPTTRATRLDPLLYRLKYLGYRAVISRAVRGAKTIIAASEFTKDEIFKNFPSAKNKNIIVTYQACAPAFQELSRKVRGEKVPGTPPLAGSQAPLAGSQAPFTFALYVGSAYPHKNLERLLEAFAEFRKKGFSDFRLVLVCGHDYFSDRLEREAKTQRLNENVIFFGKATDEQLAELFDGAAFYIFPSLCEGFGLPPLEAMCRGVPVASSRATCLPEVLGEAALYFDPEDRGSMVSAMIKIASDHGLRAELKKAGKQWSARYSWKECAEKTLEVYKGALSGKN